MLMFYTYKMENASIPERAKKVQIVSLSEALADTLFQYLRQYNVLLSK